MQAALIINLLSGSQPHYSVNLFPSIKSKYFLFNINMFCYLKARDLYEEMFWPAFFVDF